MPLNGSEVVIADGTGAGVSRCCAGTNRLPKLAAWTAGFDTECEKYLERPCSPGQQGLAQATHGFAGAFRLPIAYN